MQSFQGGQVGVLAAQGFGGSGDVFSQLIQADAAAGAAQVGADGNGFRQGLAGHEAPCEAAPHALARDGVGDALLGGQPMNQISQHPHRPYSC